MKITVITICYNAAKDIGSTIESVISQTYKDIEYVIVDGASTDGTAKIVEEYRKKFPIVFVSEKDDGIYDAMNKGVGLASGQWINFMNAGDRFVEKDVVEKISPFLTEGSDFVYGATEFRYDGFFVIRLPRPVSDFWKKMPYNHQSLFIKTTVLKEHPFDLAYRLAADYEQLLFAIKNGKIFFKAPLTVASFDNKGVSNTKTAEALREYAEILKAYGELTLWRSWYYQSSPFKILGKKLTPGWLKKIVYRNFVH